MKKIFNIVLPVLLLAFVQAGCVEDNGNYDYRMAMVADIAPLPETIQVDINDDFRLEPTITFNDPGADAADFDFRWYAYPAGMGNTTQIVELLQERVFDMKVPLVPGNYILKLRVTNRETGVYSDAETEMTVVDGDNIGVMLLSSINGEAELTLVSERGNVRRGVYEAVNGKHAGRNPRYLQYTQGTFINRKLVWILCEDDDTGGAAVDPLTFQKLYSTRDMYMFKPANMKPGRMVRDGVSSLYEVGINDGVIYTRYLLSATVPEFRVPGKGDFYLSDFLFVCNSIPVLGYDEAGRRFMKFSNVQTVTPMEMDTPDPGAKFDPRDVGMDMLEGYMCGGPDFKEDGRAVMKDDDGGIHLLSFHTRSWINGSTEKFTPVDLIDVSDHPGIKAATHFAIKSEGEFIYYAMESNKIGVSSFITGLHRGTYELIPEDLTIDCMRVDRAFSRSELWVTASDGSGGASSGTFFVFGIASDGTLTKKAEYPASCGRVVDIMYKN